MCFPNILGVLILHFGSFISTHFPYTLGVLPFFFCLYVGVFHIFATNQIVMKKKLPITKNKDVVVSWVYTWSKQQDMSIHEQRIVLRILEACQAELKGVKLKDYAGTKRKFEHGCIQAISGDVNMDIKELMRQKEDIMQLGEKMRKNHIARVGKGKCDSKLTIPFNDVLHNIDRIGNSCVNLVEVAKENVTMQAFFAED